MTGMVRVVHWKCLHGALRVAADVTQARVKQTFFLKYNYM
ncbi:hypothetical protein Z950_1126 [Sulfitobacter mediterraneus KCTC 32188]|nr:hypothetical protein Z950_1126 [Sulfitobacter mediterraneus KCTC 32188]